MIRYALNMQVEPFQNQINFDDKLMLMGSCFTDHIGARLNSYQFNTFINPNGVVFNPISLAEPINRMIRSQKYSKEDLVFHNDKWASIHHSSKFSKDTIEDTLENINTQQSEFEAFISSAEWLVITFGTAWVYEDVKLKRIVANCHKLPQIQFIKRLLEVDEIVKEWQTMIELLKKRNNQLKIIFTVSPVKHLRDGVHENNLSKGTLLLAIQKLCENDAHYFPAFELVIDDLRDYRFFESDGAHPNSMAIDYVFENFKASVLSEECNEMMNVLDKYFKLKNHRPLSNSEFGADNITNKLIEMKIELKKKYSKLNQFEF